METKDIEDLAVGDTVFGIDLVKKILLTMTVTEVEWGKEDPCFMHVKFDTPYYDINDCGIWCDMNQPIYVNERCILSTDKELLRKYMMELANIIR